MSITEYRLYIKACLDPLLALAVREDRPLYGAEFWDMAQALAEEYQRICYGVPAYLIP